MRLTNKANIVYKKCYLCGKLYESREYLTEVICLDCWKKEWSKNSNSWYRGRHCSCASDEGDFICEIHPEKREKFEEGAGAVIYDPGKGPVYND